MTDFQTLRIDRDERGVATITMDRSTVRNAFNDRLVAEMQDAAIALGDDHDVRAIVLTGAGEVFSAGADLNWMRSMKDYSFEENVADAARLEGMFRSLYDLPKPLIGRINGHALGGGTGLVATCDIAVAVADATFGFTEVLLGLAPTVISPYVVRKVGRSFARAMFVTGERFTAERALRAGLLHEVSRDCADLDVAVDHALGRCLRAGPAAVAVAKRLPDLAFRPLEEAAEENARAIAGLRVGDEGQAGMAAFLDKQPPPWTDRHAGGGGP
jgi:methylglutaconyl-CoA hydratase